LVSDHYIGAIWFLTILIHPGLECSEKALYNIIQLHFCQKESDRDAKFGLPVLDNNCVQVGLLPIELERNKSKLLTYTVDPYYVNSMINSLDLPTGMVSAIKAEDIAPLPELLKLPWG
jgi:hypothetical protein